MTWFFLLFACASNHDLGPPCHDEVYTLDQATIWGPSVQDYLDEAMTKRRFEVAWRQQAFELGSTAFEVSATTVDTSQLIFSDCPNAEYSGLILPATLHVKAVEGEVAYEGDIADGKFVLIDGVAGLVGADEAAIPEAWRDALLVTLQGEYSDAEALPDVMWVSWTTTLDRFSDFVFSLNTEAYEPLVSDGGWLTFGEGHATEAL